MLSALSRRFMQTSDLQTAQQLYATAFASATPIHLAEGFAGTPEVAEKPGEHTPWHQPPTVIRRLRPISKGAVERTIEQPMRHGIEAVQQLKQQHDAAAALQKQRFAHLFHEPVLDLGTITTLLPEERAALSEIIDGCLSSPLLEYKLPDGSVVALLNRQESCYIALHACDGVLLLPRYRLQHRVPPHLKHAWRGNESV